MKEIATNILIETDYEGVTVGAIQTSAGVIMIDTPINPKEASAWRSICTRNVGGSDRLLVLLDEHFDRVSSATNIKCPVVVHEKTAQSVTARPLSKNQTQVNPTSSRDAGIENYPARWLHAEISFTANMAINWGEDPILLEHHPGPSKGAIWVIVPESHVIFIGDTVTPGQPPFLANADFEAWLVNLHDLQLAKFKDFIIISGRGSLVTLEDIKEMERFIKRAARKLDNLSGAKVKVNDTENLAEELLKDFPAKNKYEEDDFRNRLNNGIAQYLSSHVSKKSD